MAAAALGWRLPSPAAGSACSGPAGEVRAAREGREQLEDLYFNHARELRSSSSACVSGIRYLGTSLELEDLGHRGPPFYSLSLLPCVVLFKVLTNYIA